MFDSMVSLAADELRMAAGWHDGQGRHSENVVTLLLTINLGCGTGPSVTASWSSNHLEGVYGQLGHHFEVADSKFNIAHYAP